MSSVERDIITYGLQHLFIHTSLFYVYILVYFNSNVVLNLTSN